MAMTYYAVTDDPNELAHYGILGMKWGVRKENPRHSGSRRPRSAAYKKAQSKLGKMMKSGIRKAQANWRAYNSPENKQLRAYRKYQKQTDKAIEQARKGKLKYGKLDDNQVRRVTERLALERDARMLSEEEKTWGKRLRESIGQGVITGVGSGVNRVTSEVISRRSTLKTDRQRKQQMNEMDLEQQRRMERQKQNLEMDYERRKIREDRRNAKRKAQNEANAEYYKEAASRGYNHPYWDAIRSGNRPALQTNRERARQLQAWREDNAEAERTRRQREILDQSYWTTTGRLGAQFNADRETGRNSNSNSSSSRRTIVVSSGSSTKPKKKYRLRERPGR